MAEQQFAPALTCIRVDPVSGAAILYGSRCSNCGVVLIGTRRACPACCVRDSLKSTELGTSGALKNFTIVHRSYPGIATPFIAAIIDLDGGGTLKGTLRNFFPDEARLLQGLRLRVKFEPTNQFDREKRRLVCHYFEPEQAP